MKILFIATAWIEAAAGLGLAVVPSALVSLLLGVSLASPGEQLVARIAGAAMLSLAMACWFAHCEESDAAKGLVKAMLFYNLASAAVLVYAGAGLGLSSMGLWPTAALHTALAGWCIVCLQRFNRINT